MIPSPPISILYSQDADLVRRVKAFLSALAQVRHVNSPDRLEAVLQQNSPAILVLDLLQSLIVCVTSFSSLSVHTRLPLHRLNASILLRPHDWGSGNPDNIAIFEQA